MVRERNDKELNRFRSRRGIQYTVKDGTDQQKFERVERAHQCHQHNGRQYLPPVRKRIAHQSRQLAHTAPRRGQLQSLAGSGINMECKPLFYCSATGLSLAGRCPPPEQGKSRFCFITSDDYLGISRWTTFTRYPAWRSRLPTSSEIITDRCCPPVQPNPIVR